MTITMKKNNSDQTKGKPWTESVKKIGYDKSGRVGRMKFVASYQIKDTEFISYNHLHGNISLFYINKEIVY